MTEKPLILIIDDDKMTVRTMAMALEAVGYEVIECNDGETGLQIAVERQPGLIILDYRMSKMNGIEVLRNLRQDDWGKNASVIIASNIFDVEIVNDIMSLGVQDYVLKIDVNLDDIVKLAAKYVPPPRMAGPSAV